MQIPLDVLAKLYESVGPATADGKLAQRKSSLPPPTNQGTLLLDSGMVSPRCYR